MTLRFAVSYKGELIYTTISAQHAYRVLQHKWYYTGGYVSSKIDDKTVYLHRFITNAPKGTHVDHRDRDGLNNTDDNLRISTYSQNQGNSKATKNTGLPKGVGRIKGSKLNPYCAQITYNRKKIHLGSFPTAEAAHEAYCKKAKELFGEYFNPGN